MKKTTYVILAATFIVGIIFLQRSFFTNNNTNISRNTRQETFRSNTVNGVSIATPPEYLFCPEGTTANKHTIASLWLDKVACDPGQDAPDVVVYLQAEAVDASAAIRDIGAPFFEDQGKTQSISSKNFNGIEYVEANFPARGTALIAKKVETGVIVFSVAGFTSYQQDIEKFRAAVAMSK